MTNQVTQNRRYLSEFSLYDSDHYVTFNIVDIDTERQVITVAITNEGKISVCSFELKSNETGLYFEYGLYQKEISVDDFEQVEED